MTGSRSSRRARELFRLPGFVALLTVRWPAAVADGLLQFGAASLVLFTVDVGDATSAGEVARVLLVTTLPFTVVGPFAGVLIDRWRRQRILVWANVVRIAMVGLGLALLRVETIGDDLFFGCVLVAIAANRLFLATLGTVLPRVVPGDLLVPGNAITSTGGTIALSLGVGGAGIVVARIGEDGAGPEAALLIGLVLYVVSTARAIAMPSRSLGPDLDADLPPLREHVRAAFDELRDGFRRVRGARRAWAPMVALAILRLVATVTVIASLLIVRNRDGGGPEHVAGVLLLFGVGVLVGAVAVTLAERRFGLGHGTSLRIALALSGAGHVALAPGLRLTSLYILSAIIGVAFGGAKIAADTLAQSALHDRYRGRVFTAYDVVVNSSYMVGGGVAALTLPTTDRAEAVIVAGGIAALLAAVLSRRVLGHLPPPVGLEDWDDALHALDER